MAKEFKMVVERRVQKRISPDMVRQQLQRCADLAMKGGRGRGWTYKIGRIEPPDEQGEERVYVATLTFVPTSDRESLQTKWPNICKRFAEAGCAGNLRAAPWVVVSPAGYQQVAAEAHKEQIKAQTRKEKAEEEKTLGEINIVPGDHFKRIFGRDAQIRRILDALSLAKRTEFKKRTHTLLDGEPGGGKSEIMMALADMLGKEGEAWRWFDATSMSKAGAIEEIIENPVVPPVLFIEEIEKTEEQSLRWLLGVMDTRGEIRRTNYRVGNQARNVRMVVIASANDVKLLKSVMSGALYSRFQNKVYCPDPDREIMKQILLREVKEIEGKPEWVEPALEFGYDKWGMRDPRALINILSCGGDRLLNGEYQKDYEKTMHPEDKKELLRKKRYREKVAQDEKKIEAELTGRILPKGEGDQSNRSVSKH
jgi:hypothetical protein